MSGFYGADDDPQIIDGETDLLTAEASAVDGFPAPDEPSEPEPDPIGRTWSFNWTTGRFDRVGIAPAEVRDVAALGVWIETIIHVGRYTYAVFSDEIGIDDVDAPIGEIVTPARLADLSQRLTEALLVHDRIQAVENIVLTVDGDTIFLRNMEIVYDETNRLSVTDVRIP